VLQCRSQLYQRLAALLLLHLRPRPLFQLILRQRCLRHLQEAAAQLNLALLLSLAVLLSLLTVSPH
jgi:hypothetical protein